MKTTQGLALFLIGSGIGWLTGLSFSPVVSSVLTSLLAVGAAAVAGFQSLDQDVQVTTTTEPSSKPLSKFNPWPAALLVLGIALLTPAGIYTRTHQWLEPPNASGDFNRGGAYSVNSSECNELLVAMNQGDDEGLRYRLSISADRVAQVISKTKDIKELKGFVEKLCVTR
jgi:hypothetical protein